MITKEQHVMLEQYNQLVHTVSEGLEFVVHNIEGGQQVFEGILMSMEQLSLSHEQMLWFFDGKEEVEVIVQDFHAVVQLLPDWFTIEAEQEKHSLLNEKVVPAYEAWKNNVQQFIKPYVTH
ncbi:hypothetical protein EQV77_12950 [Halobacillus fulvus]|nr:hypothetical protein EQV77_12950 [Halobacillus fulvus]